MKEKIIDCKFSSSQLDLLETCVENTLSTPDFLDEKNRVIAESLLIDIREQK